MLEEPASLRLADVWDSALLEPVAELNERMLECLHRMALTLGMQQRVATGAPADAAAVADRPANEHPWPPLVSSLAEEWRGLDAALQRRIATCPYLLIDAGCGQPERWQGLLPATVRDSAARAGYFRGPEGVALVRRTLVLVWHLTRANRLSARVLLGLGAHAAERIADCRLQDLDALAERSHCWAVPRWEHQPTVWRQLIHAARGGSAAQLRCAQLRGLQLLAATRR